MMSSRDHNSRKRTKNRPTKEQRSWNIGIKLFYFVIVQKFVHHLRGQNLGYGISLFMSGMRSKTEGG